MKFSEHINGIAVGIKYSQNNVILMINRFKCIDSLENAFLFEITFLCKKCKTENTFIQQIIISEYSYDPHQFDQPCENCDATLYCDSTFKRFSMDQ